MTGETPHTGVQLGLADEIDEPLASAPWIGSFVSLGSLLRRYSRNLVDRKLVVAISVPRRDYVAALVGTGWMLNTPTPDLGEPIDVFRAANPQTCLRAVTENRIVKGTFSSLDESRTPPRVTTGGKVRTVNYYRAVAVIDDSLGNFESGVPDPGYLGALAGVAESWLSRMAAPSQEVALVGTVKWLREDLDALIGDGDGDRGVGTPLANYVLPFGEGVATWATVIIPSVRLAEGDAIPPHCTAAILDRSGAINHLHDIGTPVVVCIVDRSVADDSAAETVEQARLANSRVVSVKEDLHWQPPVGVEALAFTVAS